MTRDYIIMLAFSILVGVISIVSFSYIAIAQPDYLRSDRDGVPFFTPQVVNPEGGEPLDMGELIRHYKGE
ncbi:MAG: hypothetical protein OQK80_04260 [Sedimenticola sp.]|nr:hypothetical protein [Sedimenticola sp.]